MESSLFSQPAISYFQPFQSPCGPSLISCEPVACEDFGAKYESISSKVCGWAGELGKDHDLRQGADHCARLFSQTAPFQVSTEFPSSELIPTAQRQSRVDFLSSATAMKSIFRASYDTESDVGVTVHRLGDWLVIDDGSELSWSPHPSAPSSPENTASAERFRHAEQQHHSCLAKVEAAKLKLLDAQQYVEKVRSMLWNAEVAAKQADDELREALAEAQQAAELCERLKLQETEPYLESAEPDSRGEPAVEEDSAPADASYQEDPELYRNFLGHSIRQLQDEPNESESLKWQKEREVPTPPACQNGELVLLDSPPASFHQVGIWKIADDASVVVGSRLLCLGNSEHPKLTLYLHDDRVISDTMLLEHWVECLMAGVPEFAICFHREGAVQSYSLYKVSELQSFLEERMELGRRVQMTLEVLRWIKRQCRLEGCSYWLSRDKKDSSLKLIRLSGTDDPPSQASPLPLCSGAAAPQGLVLKNTFLDIPDEDSEPGDFRRALSCPARFLGTEMVDLHHLSVSPLCGRVSALFFRRAVSSAPSPAAAHFFRQVLDLEAFSANSGTAWCGAVDDTDGPTPDGTGGRAVLQACSHLGLALCELPGFGERAKSVEDELPASSGSASAKAAALLAGLRKDVPPCVRGRGRHRLLPLWSGGADEQAGCSPLLFVAVPPWPGCASSQSSSASSPESMQLSFAAAALSRTADALSLQLAGEDEKRLNILALPTAALILLQLASAMLQRESCLDRSRSGQALLWRSLLAGKRFAALDPSDPPRPELQPFFSHLPSKEELLVRFEHLCGRALLLFAGSGERAPSGLEQARAASSSAQGTSEDASVPVDELDGQLARLESWLDLQNAEGKVDAALAQLSPDTDDEERRLHWGNLMDGNEACRAHQQRVAASRHLEQSVRLLPTCILEARSQRSCSALLNQLMMTFATSLSEAAVGSIGHAAEVRGGDDADGSVASLMQALQTAHEQLSRAEDLASAAGYKAASALAQASRGHLCALAADCIVGALHGGTFNLEDEVDAIQCLLEDEDEELSLNDDQDAMLLVGRLGDRALAETYAALHSTDPVVEPDAALALSLMTSGALQAAVARLRVLPPPTFSKEQCRQIVLDMLGQAVQLLPGEGSSSCPSVSNTCAEQQAALLSAQAHMTLSKVHAGLDTTGSWSFQDRQTRQQRTASWHLDKAQAALHRAASGPVAFEHHLMVTAMLIHVHLLHACFLSSGCVTIKRPHERSFEELIAASRLVVENSAGSFAGDRELPSRLQAAWSGATALVLDRVRHVLRLLCTGKNPVSTEGWKALYRQALQLQPSQLSELVDAYEQQSP